MADRANPFAEDDRRWWTDHEARFAGIGDGPSASESLALAAVYNPDNCPEHQTVLLVEDSCSVPKCPYNFDERSGPVRSRDRFGNRRKP